MRLSAAQKEMISELQRYGVVLAGRYDFSGSKVPQQLIGKGLVEICDHPDTQDRRTGRPAKAYRLTDAGQLL